MKYITLAVINTIYYALIHKYFASAISTSSVWGMRFIFIVLFYSGFVWFNLALAIVTINVIKIRTKSLVNGIGLGSTLLIADIFVVQRILLGRISRHLAAVLYLQSRSLEINEMCLYIPFFVISKIYYILDISTNFYVLGEFFVLSRIYLLSDFLWRLENTYTQDYSRMTYALYDAIHYCHMLQ